MPLPSTPLALRPSDVVAALALALLLAVVFLNLIS